MRIRRTLGLVLAAATLAGAGAVGAVSAQAAASPTITRQECTDAGGQIKSIPYGGDTCTLPDGTSQRIT
ncbi:MULTISPECIES: hypothetical protein [Streptomyces]|uniref:Uncharacterized protein n=1 Tax=Streptomyces virginiae TaxID=1961 RepID=A0ABQ3NML0_STRVG|nr:MULTISPECIES: hypothetical protein [Streptomyces]GLV96091.1 hypothetical protein Slala04_75440 [Streptomyces lavendulae subsp. lavendulae]KOU14958.1 hypothetical protein ADK49_22005 [Streptomyces sp. WM6349]KOU80729.1 hypothetical protein ADK94_28085 [Streptomyces sp. XY593]KOU89945.1 hypothetical protein ADK92_36520 [Streptomyces sp. XY533]KOV16422.1 hypothetical protein ADK91_04295 [Streptomyces sp. XY511]